MNIRAKIFGGGIVAEEPLLSAKKPKGAKAEAIGSVAVPRETRRQSNSRGEDRHRLVGEKARITHDGYVFDAELINLSGGGAMVAASFQPMLWDRVSLRLGQNGTIECAVRWIRDDRVGLEFAHETRLDCSSFEVAAILSDVITTSFPDIDFPIAQRGLGASDEGSDPDEHRRAPRHPLIWNGTLHHGFESDAVRVRNISSTGAMVETRAKVRVGSEPSLDLGSNVSIRGTVEWAVGDQVGLRFHAPFDLKDLAKSRPTVAASTWQPPSYMELEQDDRWDRLSLSELRQELEGFLKR